MAFLPGPPWPVSPCRPEPDWPWPGMSGWSGPCLSCWCGCERCPDWSVSAGLTWCHHHCHHSLPSQLSPAHCWTPAVKMVNSEISSLRFYEHLPLDSWVLTCQQTYRESGWRGGYCWGQEYEGWGDGESLIVEIWDCGRCWEKEAGQSWRMRTWRVFWCCCERDLIMVQFNNL